MAQWKQAIARSRHRKNWICLHYCIVGCQCAKAIPELYNGKGFKPIFLPALVEANEIKGGRSHPMVYGRFVLATSNFPRRSSIGHPKVRFCRRASWYDECRDFSYYDEGKEFSATYRGLVCGVDKYFDLWSKFRVLTEISIFGGNFYSWPKFSTFNSHFMTANLRGKLFST